MPIFVSDRQTLPQSCGGVSLALAIYELTWTVQPPPNGIRQVGEVVIYPAVSENLAGQKYSIPAKMVGHAIRRGRTSYLRESVSTTLKMRGLDVKQHLQYALFYLIWNIKYLTIPKTGITATHLGAGEKALIACEINPADMQGQGLHYLLVRQGPAGITVYDAAYGINNYIGIGIWDRFVDGNGYVNFAAGQRGYKYLGISVVVL